jgi:hypothetical protein
MLEYNVSRQWPRDTLEGKPMRHTTRFYVLSALIGIALAVTGCVGKSCAGSPVPSTSLQPKGITMKPGETRTFSLVNSYERDGQWHSNPAGGQWVFDARGPAQSTPVKTGGSTCSWTAPSTPGKYTIMTTGKESAGDGLHDYTAVVTVSDKAPSVEQSAERPAAALGEPVKAFEVGNVLGIRKGAKAPSFTLDKDAVLVTLQTYHYIDGGGPAPGTLALKDAKGKTYGPWQATGIDGQGNVKNAFWNCVIDNAPLPAGRYTIVDSDPGTWSTNDKAGGLGFCTVMVRYPK